MIYPDQKNTLVINDVNLFEKFKMVLADGYTLSPPSPKTYIVDVPGGNGKLDLTETMLGDVAYDNRTQEFMFYLIDITNFEEIKTKISNFLHGRVFDYKMTMDEGYTYRGRFSVSSYEHSVINSGILGCIKITIDANPFKHKPRQRLSKSAVGGIITYIPSGRETVRPVIINETETKIIYNGKQTILPPIDDKTPGWEVDGLFLVLGDNEIYINSHEIHSLKWGECLPENDNITWGTFGTKRLFEWYKSKPENGNYVSRKWSSLSNQTWSEKYCSKWSDVMHTWLDENYEEIPDVKIEYEWGDL